MKKINTVRIIPAIVLLLAVVDCSGGPIPYQAKDDPIKRIDKEGVIITLRFIDDQTLKRLFGKGIINPFIARGFILQRTRFSERISFKPSSKSTSKTLPAAMRRSMLPLTGASAWSGSQRWSSTLSPAAIIHKESLASSVPILNVKKNSSVP